MGNVFPSSVRNTYQTQPCLVISVAPAMADQSLSEIIKSHPIGKRLDGFRASFNSIHRDKSIPYNDALDRMSYEGTAA